MTSGKPRTLRHRLFLQLEPVLWHAPGLSPLNKLIILLVVVSVGLFVLETEPALTERYGHLLHRLDLALGGLFAAEYLARLWTAGELPRYRDLKGRLRWMLTPMALVDLVAFLPSLLTFGMADGYILGPIRLLRLARLAKLGRYSTSLLLIELTLRRTWRELAVAVVLAVSLLLTAATLMWLIEHDVQPEAFGSIPRALWWAVITLTTVGYGDVYPVTVPGRIVGGLVALIGIGTIALPAGILSAGFVDVTRTLNRRKRMLHRVRQARHQRLHQEK